jgi:hypothetical protein
MVRSPLRKVKAGKEGKKRSKKLMVLRFDGLGRRLLRLTRDQKDKSFLVLFFKK